jgi:hypothetical protein
MTENEFLAILLTIRGKYKWRTKPTMRTKCTSGCPLTVVCREVTGKLWGLGNFDRAGQQLGLSTTLTWQIEGAADGYEQYQELRVQMIEALGLTTEG